MPSFAPGASGQTRGSITVVLAEFDDLFASGLRQLIEGDPSLELLAHGVEQRRIPVVLRAHRPDVAILDLDALGKPAEVRELSVRCQATRLVLIAETMPSVEAAQLLAFGASACLSSSTQSRDVLNAIHLASRGLQLLPSAGPSSPDWQLLTRREAEVLALLQQGRSNAQIAAQLSVGMETVRTHASHIYAKLGISSRRELLAPARHEPREADVKQDPPTRVRPIARSRRRGHDGAHS